MRPFLAYATNGASTLNALIEGADFNFEMLLYCAPWHRRIVRDGEA